MTMRAVLFLTLLGGAQADIEGEFMGNLMDNMKDAPEDFKKAFVAKMSLIAAEQRSMDELTKKRESKGYVGGMHVGTEYTDPSSFLEAEMEGVGAIDQESVDHGMEVQEGQKGDLGPYNNLVIPNEALSQGAGMNLVAPTKVGAPARRLRAMKRAHANGNWPPKPEYIPDFNGAAAEEPEKEPEFSDNWMPRPTNMLTQGLQHEDKL